MYYELGETYSGWRTHWFHDLDDLGRCQPCNAFGTWVHLDLLIYNTKDRSITPVTEDVEEVYFSINYSKMLLRNLRKRSIVVY